MSDIPRITPPDDRPLGTWGQRTEYDLAGNVVFEPLVWFNGGAPNSVFARSQIIDTEGLPLEWWIELKGSKAQLSADVELMKGKVEVRRDVAECVFTANCLERIARGHPRLRQQPALQAPTPTPPIAG